jgi:hypothetical protein
MAIPFHPIEVFARNASERSIDAPLCYAIRIRADVICLEDESVMAVAAMHIHRCAVLADMIASFIDRDYHSGVTPGRISFRQIRSRTSSSNVKTSSFRPLYASVTSGTISSIGTDRISPCRFHFGPLM